VVPSAIEKMYSYTFFDIENLDSRNLFNDLPNTLPESVKKRIFLPCRKRHKCSPIAPIRPRIFLDSPRLAA
jgi:hypothetical protein